MTKECVLILDNLRSVENTASIFRTADSFGVSRVVLIGITPSPIDRFGRLRADFSKVSLGAEKSVKWSHVEIADKVISDLKKEGYRVIALEQHPDSKRLRDFMAPAKFALIVGSEIDGVSQDLLKISDDIVEIPMMGTKESLNVSVATGVALFHLLKN